MFKCVKVGVKCSCVGGTTPASGFIKEKDQSGLENGFLSENKKRRSGEVKFKSPLMPIKVRSFRLIRFLCSFKVIIKYYYCLTRSLQLLQVLVKVLLYFAQCHPALVA